MVLVRPSPQPADQAFRDEAQKQLRANAIPILGTFGDLLLDRPGFVARDDDEGPFGNTVKALTRFNCRRWAAADKTGFSPRVNIENSGICGPYLDSIGEGTGSYEISDLPPGGSCDLTEYRVTYVPQGFGQSGNPAVRNVTGPFGGVRWVVNQLDTSGRPNSYQLQIFGRRAWQVGAAAPGIFAPRWIFLGTQTVGPETPAPTVSVTDVVVLAGPDDCGDAPSLVQPPGAVRPIASVPPSINIDLPGIGPVDVTLTLGPDGTPTFCIPALDICVTVPIGGEDPVDGGEGVGGPNDGPPGDVGQPSPPVDTNSEGEAEGEAGEDQVLGALKINVLSSPLTAKEFAAGVFRGACYVYMGTDAGLDHDPAGAMLRDGQLVLPEKDNLTRWQVVANSGYNLRITPYYFDVEV